MAAKIPSNP
jgi:hypothetical protein